MGSLSKDEIFYGTTLYKSLSSLSRRLRCPFPSQELPECGYGQRREGAGEQRCIHSICVLDGEVKQGQHSRVEEGTRGQPGALR